MTAKAKKRRRNNWLQLVKDKAWIRERERRIRKYAKLADKVLPLVCDARGT